MLLCCYREPSLKYKLEKDLLSDVTSVKQVQDNNKKPSYLQLVLAGVKYNENTEKDVERN